MTMQRGFVFDINKCTGCQACSIACEIENELEPGANWRQVTTFNEGHHPGVLSFHLSVACNHCVDPPCMKNCPALAYSKDAVTGAVTVSQDLCIGCRYCTWACPYDAPRFSSTSGVIEKCTFCNHRLHDGLAPACVTSCPTGALKLDDHTPGFRNGSVPGFPESVVEPAIRFIPLEQGRVVPEAVAPESADPAVPLIRQRGPASNASLTHEWVLVFFTLLVPAMFGVFVSVTDVSLSSAVGYIGCGAVGMAATAAHLGRWKRAHRAILNWRGSWLSREIILVSLFLGLSSATLLAGWTGGPGRWLAVLIGIAALYAIDQVYHVTATRRLDGHSARVMLTGLLFIGLFARYPAAIVVAGGIKMLLYLYRKRRFARAGLPVRPVLSFVRLGVGIIAPAVMWYSAVNTLWPFVIATVVIGEVIDRCEFYMELDVPTLSAVSVRDLDREIAHVARAQA
jgi:DMSO reductase iron-sulfur subunit